MRPPVRAFTSGSMTAVYSRLRACTVSAAAMVMCRSLSRASPPDTAVNAWRERRLPAHDLEHHLADVDVGDHRLHAGPQVGQARRIGNRIDLGGVQPAVGIDDHLDV